MDFHKDFFFKKHPPFLFSDTNDLVREKHTKKIARFPEISDNWANEALRRVFPNVIEAKSTTRRMRKIYVEIYVMYRNCVLNTTAPNRSDI